MCSYVLKKGLHLGFLIRPMRNMLDCWELRIILIWSDKLIIFNM